MKPVHVCIARQGLLDKFLYGVCRIIFTIRFLALLKAGHLPMAGRVIDIMKLNLRSLLKFLALAGCFSFAYGATFDDFNDGIDDGWRRYDPIPGKFSFPVESGSVAYKMESSWGSLFSPGRIGSINMNEPPHAKFHVEADLLNWTYNWGEDIGLVARLQEPVPSFFLPKGYALLLRNDKNGRPASRKLMIIKCLGGIIPPIFLSGEQGRLMMPAPDPSGDYRLKFWSEGGYLWGQIIDKSTGEAIKMWNGSRYTDRISAPEDGAFPSGRSGLIAYVHIVGYKAEGVSPTFDNFYSGTEAPPATLNACLSKSWRHHNDSVCSATANASGIPDSGQNAPPD
jgi:hypothetical protein